MAMQRQWQRLSGAELRSRKPRHAGMSHIAVVPGYVKHMTSSQLPTEVTALATTG